MLSRVVTPPGGERYIVVMFGIMYSKEKAEEHTMHDRHNENRLLRKAHSRHLWHVVAEVPSKP